MLAEELARDLDLRRQEAVEQMSDCIAKLHSRVGLLEVSTHGQLHCVSAADPSIQFNSVEFVLLYS